MIEREVKFRAWGNYLSMGGSSPDEGEWIYWNPLEEEFPRPDMKWWGEYSQYLDSNDREIYEGDIVYIAGYGNYVAEFPFGILAEAAMEGDIENILGNIYENPELLTDSKKPSESKNQREEQLK